MKIIVLAGGTSTEREVSIVSGTMVCKALREKGHQAILVDVFCGVEVPQVDDELFMEDYDVDQAAAYMRSFDGRLAEIQAGRREFFGPNVLELCQYADVVFLALHGANGEDGKVQAAFDLFGTGGLRHEPSGCGEAMLRRFQRGRVYCPHGAGI